MISTVKVQNKQALFSHRNISSERNADVCLDSIIMGVFKLRQAVKFNERELEGASIRFVSCSVDTFPFVRTALLVFPSVDMLAGCFQ